MKTSEIVAILGKRNKGTIFTVDISRSAHTRAGYSGKPIRKNSTVQAILADYARLAAVRNAVAAGTREAPEAPAWSETFHEGGIKFIRHRTKGTEYLPACLIKTLKTEWTLDGQKVDFAAIAAFLLADEQPKERKSKEELAEEGQGVYNNITLSNVSDIR